MSMLSRFHHLVLKTIVQSLRWRYVRERLYHSPLPLSLTPLKSSFVRLTFGSVAIYCFDYVYMRTHVCMYACLYVFVRGFFACILAVYFVSVQHYHFGGVSSFLYFAAG